MLYDGCWWNHDRVLFFCLQKNSIQICQFIIIFNARCLQLSILNFSVTALFYVRKKTIHTLHFFSIINFAKKLFQKKRLFAFSWAHNLLDVWINKQLIQSPLNKEIVILFIQIVTSWFLIKRSDTCFNDWEQRATNHSTEKRTQRRERILYVNILTSVQYLSEQAWLNHIRFSRNIRDD